jgi:hypothetical protein
VPKSRAFRTMSYCKKNNPLFILTKDYTVTMNLEYILHSVVMNATASTERLTISITCRRLIMLPNIIYFLVIKIIVLNIVKNLVIVLRSVKNICVLMQGLQKMIVSISLIVPSGQRVLTGIVYIMCIPNTFKTTFISTTTQCCVTSK